MTTRVVQQVQPVPQVHFINEDSPESDVELRGERKQEEDPKRRRLCIGIWIVAAIDGLAMATMFIAVLIQRSNPDNYIFYFNLPHVLWWFVAVLLCGNQGNRIWWTVFIALTAVWLLLDAASLIWRSILLDDCYDSSSGNDCRDFLTQAWFVLAANIAYILVDAAYIALAYFIRRRVVVTRLVAAIEESQCLRPRVVAGAAGACARPLPGTSSPIVTGLTPEQQWAAQAATMQNIKVTF